LLAGEKRKRISEELMKTFLTDLAALPIKLQPLSAEEVFLRIQSLSRQHKLTPYDAAYLHLAEIGGLALATLDKDLMRACGNAGVELICE
jgi:predicted nucleic acid-binding protein